MYYDLHVTTTNAHSALLSLVEALEALCANYEQVCVLDYGFTKKAGNGFVVLEWTNSAIDDAFLAQLEHLPGLLDYSIYSVPLTTAEENTLASIFNSDTREVPHAHDTDAAIADRRGEPGPRSC